MKKAITLLLLLCIGMCGCSQRKNVESRCKVFYIDCSTNMPVIINPYIKSEPELENFEDYYPEGTRQTFVDEKVPSERTVSIFGQNLVLTYEYTQKGFYSYVKYRTARGDTVCFDPVTDEILRFQLINHEIELTTEQEYLDYIQNVLFPYLDLSQYDYHCQTDIHSGFHALNENDRSYIFSFTKSLNGYDTIDELEVGYGHPGALKNVLVVDRMKAYGYTKKDFKELLEDMDEIILYVRNQYLQTDIAEGCKIVNIGEPSGSCLFLKDGIPNVKLYIPVEFVKDDQTYEVSVKLLVQYTG